MIFNFILCGDLDLFKYESLGLIFKEEPNQISALLLSFKLLIRFA